MLFRGEKNNRNKNIKKAVVLIVSTTIILSVYTFTSIPKIDSNETIRINEIMYNPLGTDSGHEWIEIYNSADTTTNISGWRLFEANVNHTLTLISGSWEIPGNCFAIIADNYENFQDDYPQYSNFLFDSSFKLVNSGEYLAIKNESLTIIDDVFYVPQDGANNTGMSLEYHTDDVWEVSLINGGTPGEPNSICSPPCQPNEPIPENNAINQSIDTIISVKVVDFDNDTMSVFFYNSENDNLIDTAFNVSNGSRAEVSWSDLEYNTTYFWYAVANDSLFENTSEIWSFSTVSFEDGNNPPFIPSEPFPENGSVDIDLDINISWVGGDPDGDPVTYDVYLGENLPPPKLASNISESTYSLGTLNINTTYYWNIVAWDNHSKSSIGPLWWFTTRTNTPPNQPQDPEPFNGQENVSVDTILKWTCSDPDEDTLVFDVYLDENDTSPDNLVSNDQEGTNFDPKGLKYKTTYYWKIIATDGVGQSTESPIWNFTTEHPSPPIVSIEKPSEKSFYFRNNRMFSLMFNCIVHGSIDIKANVTSDVEIEKVQLFVNGELIEEDTSAPYSFEWGPNICSIYKIKVKAIDNSGQSSEDNITVIKWRFHPVLLILLSLIILKQIASPFKGSLIRGTVFNLRKVGNMYHTRALRLHLTELGLLKSSRSVTRLQRISFKNSPFIRTFDIGPLGLTKFIIGIVPGRVDV